MSKHWYTLTVQSNHEVKAKEQIERNLEGNEDLEEVFVPIEKVINLVNGKKKVSEKKIYSGYIFVHGDMTDDLYVKLKSCSKVQSVLGSMGRATITPTKQIQIMKDRISASEVDPSEKSEFDIDQIVLVVDGPFKDFEGTIKSVNNKSNKAKIDVVVFGQLTPVDIDFKSLERVS
jgi:transcriptional antiterminator NusG